MDSQYKLLPLPDLTKQFKEYLMMLQEKRDERRNLLEGTEVPEWMEGETHAVEWNVYEIKEMADLVNMVRVMAQEDPLPLEEFARVERQAAGHIDYTKKFALYCAELAHDVKRGYY